MMQKKTDTDQKTGAVRLFIQGRRKYMKMKILDIYEKTKISKYTLFVTKNWFLVFQFLMLCFLTFHFWLLAFDFRLYDFWLLTFDFYGLTFDFLNWPWQVYEGSRRGRRLAPTQVLCQGNHRSHQTSEYEIGESFPASVTKMR